MIGIDTNILLRWMVSDGSIDGSAEQAEALGKLVTMADEPAFVNHVVLAETIWVLRRRAKQSRAAAVALLEQLLETADVVIQDRDTVISAVSSLTQHPGDFSDHLIGEINRRHGCRTTFTFDRAASKSPNFSELAR